MTAESKQLPVLLLTKSDLVSVPVMQQKIVHHWTSGCDTRAIVSVIMFLRVTKRLWFLSPQTVAAWIIDDKYNPVAFDGADDLRVAFSDRSDREIVETVELWLPTLAKWGVLERSLRMNPYGELEAHYKLATPGYTGLFWFYPELSLQIE